MKSPLDRALERFDIYDLWENLGLPGEPSHYCRSPFREDRKPSFWIPDKRGSTHYWQDYGTGESGDRVDFVAKALNVSRSEACKEIIRMASEEGVPKAPVQGDESPRKERKANPDWPEDARKPTANYLKRFADMRGIPLEGVALAANRGHLWRATAYKQPCWLIADEKRLNLRLRREDGNSFGEAKELVQRGSHASTPLGWHEVIRYESILLVEGSMDFVAAHAVVTEDCAVVGVTGAGNSLPNELIRNTKGKPVVIIPHLGDKKDVGIHAAIRWRRQLNKRCSKVVILHLRSILGDKGDLNDAVRIDCGKTKKIIREKFDS